MTMLPIEIRPDIYWVGVNDRQKDLFEGLWPVGEEGVSYNSYLINDAKKAVIDLNSLDTTEAWLEQIAVITDPARLDYIIINHMEPDHSGALKLIRRIAPQATLVGSAKAAEMLQTFYGITENVMVVKDGDVLDLGSHKLKFIYTPWVHWPETIMTYDVNEKILFSCDGFGSYGSLDGAIFDDTAVSVAWYEQQALRYYANIVASFSKPVKNAVAKLADVPVSIVAPSHGLIWRSHPERIIELYAKWAGYAGQPGEDAVTLLFASMYGNTRQMMEAVAQGIAGAGVPVRVFDAARTPVSYLLPELWTNKGVMIGAPTYEGDLFPFMGNVLDMAKRKHVSNKIAAGFGSHAWMGGGQRQLAQLAADMHWEFTGSLEFKGAPETADLENGRQFGAEFAAKVKAFSGTAAQG
jgi:flavorubredoxin